MTTNRVAKGVPTGGEFAPSQHAPAGVSLPQEFEIDGHPISALEPAAIDTALVPLLMETGRISSALAIAERRLREASDALEDAPGDSYRARYELPAAIDKHERRRDELMPRLAAARAAERPFHDEFRRRGGWTRAFLVDNAGGHVHNSTGCSTCFPTTDFVWLPDFSGRDEIEVVEAAGQQACTVCFPSAPVDLLRRKSTIEVPARREARIAREAETAARRSKAATDEVLDPDTGKQLFKTDRAATNYIAGELGSMVHYGPTHPSFDRWKSAVDGTIAALAAKGAVADPEAYLATALAKARKKVEADHRKFMRDDADYYRAQGLLGAEVDQPGYSPVKY